MSERVILSDGGCGDGTLNAMHSGANEAQVRAVAAVMCRYDI
jgi:hypothetical protein